MAVCIGSARTRTGQCTAAATRRCTAAGPAAWIGPGQQAEGSTGAFDYENGYSRTKAQAAAVSQSRASQASDI